MNTEELLAYDAQHVWHPYSKVESQAPIFPVASAQGPYITLATGERLFDGMSSWWSTLHGYNHPELNRALQEQSAKFSHVMFGGLTHEPAVTLAKNLVELSPAGLEKVFISDSGSVAVEVAMKMALQYWHSKGQAKTKFLGLLKGYHGDTFGAMSVCDPVTGMHQLFSGVLHQNIFAPAPSCKFDSACDDSDIAEFSELIESNKDELAAVILEPIVQGTGGMRFYSPEYLKRVRALCDEHNVLLIADEIATGFARTGKMFACEHAEISPDILCVGKSLTGGYMSLAATLCTTEVALAVCEGEAGVFMHGPTFMGNPLACAVANANIKLLCDSQWQENIQRISNGLSDGLRKCGELSFVEDVRVLGAIGVVELKHPVDLNEIQPTFVKQGIWMRPFGKLVYTMPPYITTNEELEFLCSKIYATLKEVYGE